MKSFLAYMGGKSILAPKIIPKIPKHNCYVEVFAGAAWLLFKKEESCSDVEIINDINLDLVTLYRVVKHHLEEFVRYFKWILVSRDEFYRFRREDPSTLTDIQKAVRFYYLLKLGYAARIKDPSFSIATTSKPRLNLLRIEEELSAIHLRLSRVYIENRAYEEIFARFDKPDTFFYVDPPYYGCEDYYGDGVFSRSDFIKLRDILGRVSGKFIFSINDVDHIRELFSGFHIETVATSYSAAGANRKKLVNELLIMNYDPSNQS
ncbi:MAG: Dam family site-specific DNA-(adenine-N6)-methyltransferase [Deltaproteobacteria bacterium]|nr:Dam family site-specific DNA-(adenine-N6)-methyltransferase [Deltaproteobacteria bacterium]